MNDGAPTEPLLNLADVAEIELCVLRRMKAFALGHHGSVFRGAGFNFVGLRDWEPGDRVSSIDWAQSSLTNFSPTITREFEQDSTAPIIAVADASLSTRCGAGDDLIASAIARSIAAVGLGAAIVQDSFGLLTFDDRFRLVAGAPARVGRPHVLHCLDLYQQQRPTADGPDRPDLFAALASQLRRTSVIPVISDFLFGDVSRLLHELSLLNATHDVFLIMVDARFAYPAGSLSSGWVEAYDVESGATRILSRREFAGLAEQVSKWQDDVVRLAADADLDILRIGLDRWEMETTLVEFVSERRLRKT
jgi:uncharacterized protein (DUF58 family)